MASEPGTSGPSATGATWTFLSNHGHVLVCLANEPNVRLRDLAETVGVTERTISAVVTDLVDSGYVRRTKEGRRNRYEVVRTRRLRHTVEGHHTVGELIATLGTAL